MQERWVEDSAGEWDACRLQFAACKAFSILIRQGIFFKYGPNLRQSIAIEKLRRLRHP
jgi:hypothetical protein